MVPGCNDVGCSLWWFWLLDSCSGFVEDIGSGWFDEGELGGRSKERKVERVRPGNVSLGSALKVLL